MTKTFTENALLQDVTVYEDEKVSGVDFAVRTMWTAELNGYIWGPRSTKVLGISLTRSGSDPKKAIDEIEKELNRQGYGLRR